MNLSIRQEYDEIIRNHNCNVGKRKYAALKKELPRLCKLAMGNQSLNFCFDLHKGNYVLVDPRFRAFSGQNSNNDNGKNPQWLFMNLIHPYDLNHVLNATQQAYYFFTSLPVEEQEHFEMICHFRMRGASEKYVRVNRRMKPFDYDKDNKLWLIHIIIDQLEFTGSNKQPQAWIFNTTNKKLRTMKGDIRENKEFDYVSARQIEVMKMEADGHLACMAAKLLFVSSKTIYNQHQTIMSKTECKNMVQAFHNLKILGLIGNSLCMLMGSYLVDGLQILLCFS
jgi:DNA-binding CsgD family transcriptional regulator